MKMLFRIGAWLLLGAIIVLTVVPPAYRPVTPLPHSGEHLGIFFATGLAFGLGYETPRLFQVLGLVMFSAVIEIMQLGIVGRHARLSDFLVDAGGVCIGTGLAAILMVARGRFVA